jgi:hypothetical protein
MDESLPRSTPSRTPRADQVVIAVGVALLATAVVLSNVYSRKDGDLDWTNYLVGLIATAALLGAAAAARTRRGWIGPDDLVGWPGAAGILGVGSMVGIALDDAGGTPYVVGLVVLGLATVAYYVADQHWAFVLTGIGGLAVFYAKGVDDLFDAADLDGDNTGMVISLALLVFAAVVTGVTWFLPERVLGGVVAGAVAVFGHFVLLVGLTVGLFFQTTFVTYSGDADPAPARIDTFDNDVWVVLLVALVLAGGWAWLALQTGHVGFRVLIVGICVSVVPMATVVLAVEHPSWWSAVVGVLGTGVLGALVLRGVRGSTQPQT